MHYDANILAQYLELHGRELDRLRTESEIENDNSAKSILEEASAYYEKSLQHLKNGDLFEAAKGCLYIQCDLFFAADDVRRSRELHNPLRKTLEGLSLV